MEDYKYLCERFLNIVKLDVDQTALEYLKTFYRETINSPRISDSIKNLEDLLNVLEKRGILAHNDIAPLETIAQCCKKNNKELIEELKKYSLNVYLRSSSNSVVIDLYETVDSSDPEPLPITVSATTSDVKEERIRNLVLVWLKERLGRNWKDLARHLNVRESEIDNIEREHHQNVEEKSCKVLQIFFAKSSPYRWKLNLLSALETIRRRDLKEIVENLLSEENI